MLQSLSYLKVLLRGQETIWLCRLWLHSHTSCANVVLLSLPHNPPRDVRRVLAHFELPEDQEVSSLLIAAVSND